MHLQKMTFASTKSTASPHRWNNWYHFENW